MPQPRLVLHFDVNKTLLAADAASEQSARNVAEGSLAECLWGRRVPLTADETDPPHPLLRSSDGMYRWDPLGSESHEFPPEASLDDVRERRIVSYHDFLDNDLLPYAIEVGSEDPERTRKQNHSIKLERRVRLHHFFADEGPGAPFRPLLQRVRQAMSLNEEEKEKCRGCGIPALEAGRVHLFPSFFHAINTLVDSNRDVVVVFRTFGTDLPEVVQEYNMFCEGTHPLHRPTRRLDGSAGPDFRVRLPHSSGQMLRVGHSADDTFLAACATHRHGGVVSLVRGFDAIHEWLREGVEEAGTRGFAWRDCYEWWKANDENGHAGKLLLLDRASHSEQAIFFDDNIGHTESRIVDARDVSTGTLVDFDDVRGKFMQRVDMTRAILDVNYFLDKIHACETKC